MNKKIDLTKYSNNELLLIVSNTEAYYDLYYFHQISCLYNELKFKYKYTKTQLKVLKDYINNK